MGDRFYITLSDADKSKVQEILATGRFENAGDIIREGIRLSHDRVSLSRDVNATLRSGMEEITRKLAKSKRP